MTLKNLFILGGALAGAAYLKDKTRRDRFMGQARGLIDKVKGRANELAGDVKNEAQSMGSQAGASSGQSAPGNFASVGASGRSSYDGSRSY